MSDSVVRPLAGGYEFDGFIVKMLGVRVLVAVVAAAAGSAVSWLYRASGGESNPWQSSAAMAWGASLVGIAATSGVLAASVRKLNTFWCCRLQVVIGALQLCIIALVMVTARISWYDGTTLLAVAVSYLVTAPVVVFAARLTAIELAVRRRAARS